MSKYLHLIMMNKILSTVLISGLLISCGEKKTEEKEQVAEPTAVITNPIKVSLNAIVPKDDTLQIYYRFDPKSNFESMYVVNAVVKGSDIAQDITFDIPSDKSVSDFRIDLGNNKDQSPIEIKNFNMSFEGKSFNVKDTLFYQYFQNNEFIEYTRDKAIAKPISISGNYDPIFMPREVFSYEVQKLFAPAPATTPAPSAPAQ